MTADLNLANQQELLPIAVLYDALAFCMARDQFGIKRQIQQLSKLPEAQRAQKQWQIQKALIQSQQLKSQRAASVPALNYPAELPVVAKREDIKTAIANHQVVIIAGETGSGKTTQIPKICLELGRGIGGFIGHTQPRRLAARSVAQRLADELQISLGQQVGYKVRFADHSSAQSLIKLMTDGILLAEIQQDRYLNQYDTIIIDEAHERSLNIDFLLGYFKQLLPKRPDLKLIITSATIDPQRFSKHFNQAPIIEVSGRTFPVEVRYRALTDQDDKDADQLQNIFDAVEELYREPPGDILIFLNGEREIRDTADALDKLKLPHTEVLPLFARLSAQEQNRIFAPHTGRRIILSTNVAETSLTVPGIRYVIDPGTARLSRYSYRSKVQQLPIEAISQASANQRKGRCGRVAAGICIRLYSEEDFNGRPEFTDPEILRTNLASVILQMLALGLGDIQHFPFLQKPDSRFINDGIKLLDELGALNAERRNGLQLTHLGKQLSRLPIDPRLARMVLAAPERGCLTELLVITAALSIQDPRERPLDKQQKANELHGRFNDPDSDFSSWLKLWQYLQQQQEQLTNNQFRRLCKMELLNYLRVREWQDLFGQLSQLAEEMQLTSQQGNPADYQRIHSAILTGLLGQIGTKDVDADYLGPRQSRFYVFPGSGLFKRKPKWVMTAELVETSRLYARTVAKIEPEWVEPLAQHLVNRSYHEPHWEKKRGAVIAYEQVTLYGLILVGKRAVQYSKIDPALCHQLFIREALVGQQLGKDEAFLQHNARLIADIAELEDKSRRRDILVDEETLCAFYAEKIPQHANNKADFSKWWRQQQQLDATFLHFDPDQLKKHDAAHITAESYPELWRQGNLTLPLSYHFSPGAIDDGVSLVVPVALLNQINDVGFDWLIPGLRHELLVALIKSLPKVLRRNFVPAPNYADALMQSIQPEQGPLLEVISQKLKRMSGINIPAESWDLPGLPVHLRFNFQVVDENGHPLAQGRSLGLLKQQMQGTVQQVLSDVAEHGIEQEQLTDWSFGTLPREYIKLQSGYEIKAFPALVDEQSSVSIKLLDSPEQARALSQHGLRRLLLLNLPSPVKYLQDTLPNKAKLGLYFNPFGKVLDLIDDCIAAAVDQLIATQPWPETAAEYQQVREYVRAELAETVRKIALKVEQILTIGHDISKRLRGRLDLALAYANADIKAQLESLLFKGFVCQHGAPKLDDLQRYLQALQKRLEKLPVDPQRDRLQMYEYQKAADAYQQLLGKYAGKMIPAEVIAIRWMLEELKVSLFAQQLGTPYPVSCKRVLLAVQEFK